MRSALALAVVFAACNPDDGKPTDPIKYLTPDAGEGGVTPTGDGGLGADCTDDPQCASGKCFHGGTQSFCSASCTADNAAQVCANHPPLDGTCNKQGFCKRP